MATPEGKVKRKVTTFLKTNNVWYFFPQAGGYGRSGIPDIICCANGQFVAIECKGDGVPTKLQEAQLSSLRKHGAKTFVITAQNIDAKLYELALLFDALDAVWKHEALGVTS